MMSLMWVRDGNTESTPCSLTGICLPSNWRRAVSSMLWLTMDTHGNCRRAANFSPSSINDLPAVLSMRISGSNCENIVSTMLPKPFMTLMTHTIAAVTTPTAAALMPLMMCMALYCFLANRYRQAIFISVLTA